MEALAAAFATGLLLALAAAPAGAETDSADGKSPGWAALRVPAGVLGFLGVAWWVFLSSCFCVRLIMVRFLVAAAALGNLYTSWNSPSQLAGWSASGGDPCGAAWQGVTCSGPGVTEM